MSNANSGSESPVSQDENQATVDQIHQAMASLKSAGESGANWFFWIAGLSLVNTAILHAGGDRHFIVGLGVTAFVDVIASAIGKENPEAASIAVGIAIGFSVFVAIIVALFGWLSRKGYLWVFGVGMFFYLLDGLLYLLLGDIMSTAFHGFALYCMFKGMQAFRQLRTLASAINVHHGTAEA